MNNTPSNEVIDLEEYAKSGKCPPKGHSYRFRVDREFFKTRKSELTGREILIIAGKPDPENWLLNQKKKGSVDSIGLDEIVDLTTPGIERFMTLPIDQTEGELRREFSLPLGEAELLDEAGLEWECVIDQGRQWLLINRFSIPAGYAQNEARLAILIPSAYPTSPLDMVYVSPSLRLLDDGCIPASQHIETIGGESYQRWSRHYTSANPWKPEYNVLTHILLARHWFTREVATREVA